MDSWAAGHKQVGLLSDSAIIYNKIQNSGFNWWGMTQKRVRESVVCSADMKE